MGWLFGSTPKRRKRRRSSEMPPTIRKRRETKTQRWAREARADAAWGVRKAKKNGTYRSPQFRKFWPNL